MTNPMRIAQLVRRHAALVAALEALEQEMRTPRPGFNVTDAEWADRLAALLHPRLEPSA